VGVLENVRQDGRAYAVCASLWLRLCCSRIFLAASGVQW